MRVVVQRPDGSPATDAVVVFTPSRDDEAARAERQAASKAFPADEPQRFALLAANGTRYRVDERGGTRVPKNGYVLAFAGELVVRRFVGADEAEPRLVLPLVPPRPFTVDVVTADGASAVGVPVALQESPRHGLARLAPTGADGTLAVRLATRRAEGTVVVLDIVSKTPVTAPLPADGERVRLQLPATTAVVATFAGELAPGSTLAWSLQYGEVARRRDGEPPAGTSRRVAGDRTGDRSASWPFVEVGIVTTASVQLGALEVARGTATSAAGSEPIALSRTITAPTFALQILDVDGAPVRNRVVDLQWKYRNGSSGERATTNREGWIEVEMPARFAARADVTLGVSLNAAGSSDVLVGTGTVAVKADGYTRIVLPPLRCEPLPVLVAGIVVTADGTPVPDLELSVRAANWQRLRTDRDGRFVARGATEKRPVYLDLAAAWCFVDGPPWRVELAGGTKDARLVVQRAARVRFAADLKQSVHSRIDYRLEPATGEGQPVELPFTLGQRELLVPPGHWHFVVHSDGNELLRLPDLRGESGVETHDPRFMAFDWRAYAVLVELTVRDAKGQPYDDCTVWLRHEGGGSGTSPTNGVLHLLVPKDGSLVDVEPRDTKLPKAELGKVTADQVVVLGGGPSLTVTLQPMPQLPAGHELLLAIDDGDGVPFDARGVAIVLAPKPGSFTPAVRLRKGDTRFGPLDWKLPAIDVPSEGKATVIELTPSRQQQLDGTIERLRKM